MNLILQRKADHWECLSATAGTKSGVGQTAAEAVGNCVLANPEWFGLDIVRYDLSDMATRIEVERMDLPAALSVRKGLPIPFQYQRKL